jgi:FtsP/CotA-like multicopper oxidase with cupredoxin domain
MTYKFRAQQYGTVSYHFNLNFKSVLKIR